jgi:hypothetical protein
MCPNINLLKSYKVYPRKLNFNYMSDKFFIYVYLDPFQPLNKPLKFNINQNEYCFAYMPIYIGKGTGAGYRHNQHIASFVNSSEKNKFKVAAFHMIQENMAAAAAKQENDKPWNWKEYQAQFVVILETFNDPKQLLKFEMEIINKIGRVQDHSGPLTNIIKNAYKFDNLSQGRKDLF